jgi:hypothetical protein
MELNTTPAPVAEQKPDAESQAWAAMEKELGDVEEAADAPAPEATPEPAKAEPAATAEPDSDDAKLTPEQLRENYRRLQGALKEERQSRKAEAERNKNMAELVRQIAEQRKAAPAAQAEPEAPKAPVIPDINEDPIGHFQAKTALLEQQLAEVRGTTTKTQEQIAAERQHNQFWGEISAQESEFKARTPDYTEATTFLETARMKELQIMFPDDAPGAIQLAQENKLGSVEELRWAMLNADRISIAQQAKRVGVNAGQLYYNLAQHRGYAPKSATPAAPAAPKINPVMAAAKAGQAAVNAGRSGATTDNDMTLDDIADLYLTDPAAADKEFKKLADRSRTA